MAEGPWCSWGPRARPRPPRRHGRGQGRRWRSGARARGAGCAPPPLRPSSPAGPLDPPWTALIAPNPLLSSARRPGARCGATIAAWRSGGTVVLALQGGAPGVGREARLGAAGCWGAGSGGAPKGKQGRGYRGNGQACAPGCEGLELQTHFSPRRAATGAPRAAGGQRGGEGGRRRRLGWAGGLGRRGAGGRGQGPC